ncbi:MAG TPA: TerC family protein [Gemmatimonadales bacterium]|nr:TerC family protein [Gemmatimonadales bacterium]
MGHHPPGVWLGFTGLVVALLAFDLGILNRRAHKFSLKEAMSWSIGLIALALAFGLLVLWREGSRSALEYYTGYIIELSLSVDNLFVFILIFSYFGVPAAAQPKVLNWGILGAIVMRLIMIALGAFLLERFEWIIYVFGGILVLTGIRMFTQRDARIEPEKNPVVRLARRLLPFADHYDGARFTTRVRGRRLATPLLLVLLVVESSDVLFAIDSIPAVFAVTRDPFIVYSSNVFAVLGLRALFFVLAGLMDKFVYLKPGVALILVLVGIKMALSGWVHVPVLASLVAIIAILGGAVALSLFRSAASRVE